MKHSINRQAQLALVVGLAIIGFLMSPVKARAVPTPLTLDLGLTGIQQTNNNPCWAGNSCGPNDGLDFTKMTGGNTTADNNTFSSPTGATSWTLGNLRQIAGATNTLAIFLDVNQTGGSAGIYVNELDLDIGNNGIDFQYINPGGLTFTSGNAANQFCPYLANGNGRSDCGFVQINLSPFAGLPDSTLITFHTTYSNNDDGFETFFVGSVNCSGASCFPVNVPEPSAIILFGAGLVFVSKVIKRLSGSNS